MSNTNTEAFRSDIEQVKEFYKGFKQDEFIATKTGVDDSVITKERLDLKLKLIAEEFGELVGALYGPRAEGLLNAIWPFVVALDEGNRDLVETVDAMADLRYVLAGLAIEGKIPADKAFTIVHESNMSKLDENGEPIISDGVTPSEYDGEVKPAGKILKSKNFHEPDFTAILP